MKFLLLNIIIFFLFVPVVVFGVTGGDLLKEAGGKEGAGFKNTTIETTAQSQLQSSIVLQIVSLIKTLLQVLGVVLLIIIIYAGVTWMTAGGNQEKVTTAGKWITNGIIGMIVVSLSWAIALFIENFISK